MDSNYIKYLLKNLYFPAKRGWTSKKKRQLKKAHKKYGWTEKLAYSENPFLKFINPSHFGTFQAVPVVFGEENE